MEDALYGVLITGQVAGHISREQAVAAFAQLFCLSHGEADGRLAAAPFIVRGRLTLEQAQKYCRVIRRQGIGCEMVEEAHLPGLYPRLSASEG